MKRSFLLIVFGLIHVLLCVESFAATSRAVLTEAKVRQVVTDYLLQRTENMGVEIRIKSIGFSGEVTLAPGKTSYEIVSSPDWEGWGRTTLALIVRVDDRLEKNIPLTVDVEAVATIVVAARPLDFGMIIKPTDVVMQKRDLSQIQGRVCRTLDEVLGKRIKLGMRVNTPIRSDYLERPPLVKSGQMVTIILENSSFRITATGRARGNGAEGDMIMVQNPNAQKEIPAIVLRDGSVKVEF